MSFLHRSLLTVTLSLCCGLAPAHAAESNRTAKHGAPAADSSSTAARVIVKYRSGASVLGSSKSSTQSISASGPQLASAMGERLGLSLSNGRALSVRSQVLTGKGMSSRVLAEKLAADSDVEWAEVDQRVFAMTAPNDPLYADNQTSTTPTAGQWYLRATTSAITSSIDAETAWAITQGSSSIVVAVVDTGVRSDHPDLSSKLLSGYDFISDSSVANDGDGRDSDPSDPGDWITSSEAASGTFKDCTVEDSSWHGTMTASLIGAATNNGIGMAGVAPNVLILPVRALGKCGGYTSDIAAGMRWAGGLSVSGVSTNAYPAKVINLSLGSSGSCGNTFQEAVTDLVSAGVVVVAAAGNDGEAVGAPANCSGVIAVAGLRQNGTKAGYSNFGSAVTISAPSGNCVNSTGTCVYPILAATNTGTTSPDSYSASDSVSYYTDGSNYSVGTSFSSPLVAGVAALMLSANSSLTVSQVKSLLQSSARSFPTSGADTSGTTSCPSSGTQTAECYCTTSSCGAGMLDAGAAVTAAQSASSTSSAPSAVISTSATKMLVGGTLTLSGSSSTAAASRSIASYAWSISSGSSYAQFTTSTTSSSVTIKGVAEGTVTIKLTVTDSAGSSASSSQAITVAAGTPTASFTVSDSTPNVGDSVTLNGSASAAQGSASLSSYLWEITDGTSLASFSGSTTGSSATLSATAAGAVTVRLTVTDSNGYTGSSSQTITITSTSSSSSASSSSSSGGGGGALTPLWGLGLLLLALLLGRHRKRGI